MIHSAYNVFLAIYLAHLLTDFVFQTDRRVSDKQRGRWHGYFVHGLIHYITLLAVMAIADPYRFLHLRFQLIALSLSLAHVAIDWLKIFLTNSNLLPRNATAFVLDQIAHLLTVIGAAFLLVHPSLQALQFWIGKIQSLQEKILVVVLIYVLVIFAGGYFIREIIQPLWTEEPGHKTHHEEVINAGLYIGWLERFLVLTALFLQSPATVGFILAAKSIARFPELKSERFAEYFLIGTLLSVTVAIAGAIVLLKVLYGSVAFGK